MVRPVRGVWQQQNGEKAEQLLGLDVFAGLIQLCQINFPGGDLCTMLQLDASRCRQCRMQRCVVSMPCRQGVGLVDERGAQIEYQSALQQETRGHHWYHQLCFFDVNQPGQRRDHMARLNAAGCVDLHIGFIEQRCRTEPARRRATFPDITTQRRFGLQASRRGLRKLFQRRRHVQAFAIPPACPRRRYSIGGDQLHRWPRNRQPRTDFRANGQQANLRWRPHTQRRQTFAGPIVAHGGSGQAAADGDGQWRLRTVGIEEAARVKNRDREHCQKAVRMPPAKPRCDEMQKTQNEKI